MIEYENVFCPECKAAVGFNEDTGKFECAQGHSFAEMPQPAVEPSLPPHVPLAETQKVKNDEVSASRESVSLALAPPVSVEELPAGDIIIPIRFAERHVIDLKSQAEAMGKTLPEWVQSEVQRFLDNEWFGR